MVLTCVSRELVRIAQTAPRTPKLLETVSEGKCGSNALPLRHFRSIFLFQPNNIYLFIF